LSGEEMDERRTAGSTHPPSPTAMEQFRKRRRMRSIDAGDSASNGPGDNSAAGSPAPAPAASEGMRAKTSGRAGEKVSPPTTTSSASSAPGGDKFFPDFCPPRAAFGRPQSPMPTSPMQVSTTPVRRNHQDRRGDDANDDDDDIRLPDSKEGSGASTSVGGGCASIALDMVTGAAKGSFCLGPAGWRR
jgi:hypothetical protein